MTAALMILAALLAALLIGAAIIAVTLALGAAFGAAFAWGYVPIAAAVYGRRQRRSLAALQLPPSLTYRPLPSPLVGDVQAAEYDGYWTAAREAAEGAERPAAVLGRHGRPQSSPTVAYTAVLPPVAVTDAAGLPWTAPVAEPVGGGR